ncbi:MAG: TSUP family transporter [Oligoflexia bacterium]|nr:TSUP family transporter [Oligoflexia bacterium]
MEIWILSLAALVAGFIDAVAGGGGVITFPAFILLGLPVAEIVGTNKLVSTAGTTIAAYTFFRKGHVQAEVARNALPFTFLGALLGAATILLLPNDFLKPIVSILIIAVAIYCHIRPQIGINHAYQALTTRSRRLLQLAAIAIGFYDGFFGPGTGIFLTFFFVGVLHCDFLRATANTKVLNWTSNIVSLGYFLSQGNIRFDLGLPMLLANIVGGYLGAHTAISRGSSFIKWIYLLMAVLTGAKLLVDMLSAP